MLVEMLQWDGQMDDAKAVADQALKDGLWTVEAQRSTHLVPGLTTVKPWWDGTENGLAEVVVALEECFAAVKDELLAKIDSDAFQVNKAGGGYGENWKQLTLFHNGKEDQRTTPSFPVTTAAIKNIQAAMDCKCGSVKFSKLRPGTHIKPHCGPTNMRLRLHLGLVVPEGLSITVGGDKRTWMEGKVIIFDDSYEHEVHHDGTSERTVLMVDIWHPEATDEMKAQFSQEEKEMFERSAKERPPAPPLGVVLMPSKFAE